MSRTLSFPQFVELMSDKSKRTNQTFEKLSVRVRRQLSYEAKKNATTFPRRRTSELYKSIIATLKPTQNELNITLSAGNEVAYYARFVELGTVKMQPRFYLKRAYSKVNEFLPKDLKRYLGMYLRNPDFYGQRE
jgi:HK97 gp10 family phage protein